MLKTPASAAFVYKLQASRPSDATSKACPLCPKDTKPKAAQTGVFNTRNNACSLAQGERDGVFHAWGQRQNAFGLRELLLHFL